MWARLGLLWVVLVLAVGWLQRERAENAGLELAISRGHQPVRLDAKPSFGNMLVWKCIYEHEDRYFVDAIRTGFETTVYPGQSIAKLNTSRDLPWLNPESRQAEDLERFRWFSGDFLALDPVRPNFVIDMRYSMLPDEIEALWGIQLEPMAAADQHVGFVWDRKVTAQKRARLLELLRGD